MQPEINLNQVIINNSLFTVLYKKTDEHYDQNQKIKEIQEIIEKGADINAQDKNYFSYSALHVAIHQKETQVVEFLLNNTDKQVDINLTNDKGITAIQFAQNQGNNDIKQLFNNYVALLENIPKPTSIVKFSKADLSNFIKRLFEIDVSDQVLVDITLNEDPQNALVLIVGRPEVLGSSRKQMRHVTPYSFINNAISEYFKSKCELTLLKQLIPDFIQTFLPLLLPIKDGICLSKEQFENSIANNAQRIINKNKTLSEQDLYDTKLNTKTANGQANVWYLISNPEVKKIWFDENNINGNVIKTAQDNYQSKWIKYIKFGIQNINQYIVDNDWAITDAAELVARLILTIFNQSKTVCFADEGNTLLTEIRKYKTVEGAKKGGTPYDTYSHKTFCTPQIYNKLPKDQAIIRVVNNEGSIVKHIIKALTLLNDLMDDSIEDVTQVKNLIKQYNDFNTFKTVGSLSNQEAKNYIDQLSSRNYKKTYHNHIAKHLYDVFDFKPLEKNVFAPISDVNDTKINAHTIYPSASGSTTAKYASQSGEQYRSMTYNQRSGYNEHAMFRNELAKEIPQRSGLPDEKELLVQRIISHFFISLLPFPALVTSSNSDQEDKYANLKVSCQTFYQLVAKDYHTVLDEQYRDFVDTKGQYYQELNEKLDILIRQFPEDQLNKSHTSSNIDSAESQTIGVIPEIPDTFS